MTIENCQSKKAEDFENNQPKMTLDEVIKALDVCTQSKGCKLCPYSIYDEDGFNLYDDCPSMYNDALHYLKEYRDDKDEIDSTRLAYLDILTDYVALKNYWAEQQENEPLTWDELKSMEGKAVWAEEENQPSQ